MSKHKRRRAATVLAEMRRRDKLRELDMDDSVSIASKGELPGWLKKMARERLPANLSWIDLAQSPPLYTTRGERLCEEGAVGIIRLLQRPERESAKFLDQIGEYVHTTSLARLVERLIEEYVCDNALTGHHWVIAAHREFNDRSSFENLTEVIICGRVRRTEKLQALLSAFRDDEEIGQPLLHALCFLPGQEFLRATAVSVLPSAQDRGVRRKYQYWVGVDQLRPLDFEAHTQIMRALGFDDLGARPFEIGGEVRWVRLGWLEERDVEALIQRLWGDALHEAPDEIEHEQEVERGGERALMAIAQIFGVLLEQGALLLERMRSQKTSWSRAVWRETFIEPVFMRMWSSRIVWGVYEGRHLIETFRVCEDMTLADFEDEVYEIPRGRRVGIVTNKDLSPEARRVWAERMASYELISPINQLEEIASGSGA
ncbi:MAG: DUF4132 domain-containing protein [Myxococcota bacterium]|nr:DUF4132 domain-containing protein [Myxococcota bacterium]MEC9440903.1 DUF4132 domain-containing protein [Myxococcota bacterium]